MKITPCAFESKVFISFGLDKPEAFNCLVTYRVAVSAVERKSPQQVEILSVHIIRDADGNLSGKKNVDITWLVHLEQRQKIAAEIEIHVLNDPLQVYEQNEQVSH